MSSILRKDTVIAKFLRKGIVGVNELRYETRLTGCELFTKFIKKFSATLAMFFLLIFGAEGFVYFVAAMILDLDPEWYAYTFALFIFGCSVSLFLSGVVAVFVAGALADAWKVYKLRRYLKIHSTGEPAQPPMKIMLVLRDIKNKICPLIEIEQ